jgi:cysteine desulfurase family protein
MSSLSSSARNNGLIYFDNAATSHPKPPEVAASVFSFINEIGASPGRSGHRLSIEAGRIVFEARDLAAALFNAADPMRVAFGLNATDALNLAIKGVLRPGDHVVAGGMEHNSVMRPLRDMERRGVQVSVTPCSPEGLLDPDDVRKAIRPNTRLVALNHASNVTGVAAPIREVGRVCSERGPLFLVDAAQTAGCFPLDMQADFIDLLAFTGHKALLGPQGTGGLVIGKRVKLDEFATLRQGGTGSRSEHETHPDFAPDMFEAGTPNAAGIAGLLAGLRFISRETVEKIHARDAALADKLISRLKEVAGLKIIGEAPGSPRTATVSFVMDGLSPSEIGLRLDEEFGVLCRVGLHCAPAAHKSIGSFPEGAVRFGLGCFNTEEQIDFAASALKEIASGPRR